MSLLTFFFGKQTEITRIVNKKPATITLDALLSESFKADAEATDHPVEDDSDVTDHVILKPTTLQISGVVTESQLNLGSSIAGAATSVGAAVGQKLASKLNSNVSAYGSLAAGAASGLAGKTLAGLIGQGNQGGGRRLQWVIEELIAARDTREPITIVTGLQKYEDYVLTSVSVDRDQSSGKSMKVQLQLKKLIKVHTETVIVSIPSITSGVGKKSLGKQNTNDPDDRQKQGASLMYQGFIGN